MYHLGFVLFIFFFRLGVGVLIFHPPSFSTILGCIQIAGKKKSCSCSVISSSWEMDTPSRASLFLPPTMSYLLFSDYICLHLGEKKKKKQTFEAICSYEDDLWSMAKETGCKDDRTLADLPGMFSEVSQFFSYSCRPVGSFASLHKHFLHLFSSTFEVDILD